MARAVLLVGRHVGEPHDVDERPVVEAAAPDAGARTESVIAPRT